MSDERLRKVEMTLASLETKVDLTNDFLKGNLSELKTITKSNVDLISDVHGRTATLEDSREKKAKWTFIGATAIAGLWVKIAWDYIQHGNP